MPTKNKAVLAALCFVIAFVAYWGFAYALGKAHTGDAAYFNLLAEAFLNGRLYLTNPPTTIDLTLHNGNWYVPFPPLPALLMLPWVAVAGVASLNTTVFAALFGALNVALVFLILRGLAERRWSALSTVDTLWLTALFGLGSVHWYMATIGEVWFVAQICTVTFVALATLITVQRGPAWLAGLAVGLAVAPAPQLPSAFRCCWVSCQWMERYLWIAFHPWTGAACCVGARKPPRRCCWWPRPCWPTTRLASATRLTLATLPPR